MTTIKSAPSGKAPAITSPARSSAPHDSDEMPPSLAAMMTEDEAVAAPVRGSGGGLVAAMTIAGPGYRVNAATLPGLTARLRDAAAEVSWRLGHLKRG